MPADDETDGWPASDAEGTGSVKHDSKNAADLPSRPSAGMQRIKAGAKPNCFVKFTVKQPCASACITFVICVICFALFMEVVLAEGAEIFSDGTASDLDDINSIRVDAKEAGKANAAASASLDEVLDDDVEMCSGSWGMPEQPCNTDIVETQTEPGHVVIMVHDAGSDQGMFTASVMKNLRKIEDKIIEHKKWPKYCFKERGIPDQCAQPLSVLNLFYADKNIAGDIGEVVDELDAMDSKPGDGKLDVFTDELTPPLMQVFTQASEQNQQEQYKYMCNHNMSTEVMPMRMFMYAGLEGTAEKACATLGYPRELFDDSCTPADGDARILSVSQIGERSGSGSPHEVAHAIDRSVGDTVSDTIAHVNSRYLSETTTTTTTTTTTDAPIIVDVGVQLCLHERAMLDPSVVDSTAKSVFDKLKRIGLSMSTKRGDDLQDVKKTVKLASYMNENIFFTGYVSYYFDSSFSVKNPDVRYLRGTILFGMPLAGYDNQDVKRDEQRNEGAEWFSDNFQELFQAPHVHKEVESLFFVTPLLRDEFLSIIINDMLLAILSLLLVFSWLWLQTGSSFLATAGIMEIMLSLPIAFFFYRKVFGFMYFDGLNAMTLFIVLAIGADDIFVFMDAYKQSAYYKDVCKTKESRFDWIYRRAAGAMFVTSLTTCCAFLATAVCPLYPVKSFGIFSAFVIAVDYALVISWFPACVVLYHDYLEWRPCCCQCNKCCKMVCCDRQQSPCDREKVGKTTTEIVQKMEGDEVPEDKRRLVERLINKYLIPLIVKKKLPLIAFFLLLDIPWIILATQIEAAQKAEQFLPEDHPLQRVITIMGSEFPSTSTSPAQTAHMIWGIDTIDRTGVDLLRDDKNRGELLYDKTFEFNEETQQHIYDFCDAIKSYELKGVQDIIAANPEATVPEGQVDCVVMDWKDWLEELGHVFPCPKADLDERMTEFLGTEMRTMYGTAKNSEIYGEMIGRDMDTREVNFVSIQVGTVLNQRKSFSNVQLKEYYAEFEDWVAEVNKKGTGKYMPDGHTPPSTANKAFQTIDGDFDGPLWMWMNTQNVFIQSSITGCTIGSILAFSVIWVCTQQIIVAVGAFITIVSILLTVLGMMQAAGFELGITSSISLTILAGFAVDYVVHLAHSFANCLGKTREAKCEEAMKEMGISVLSGMVTSALAASALFGCTLTFFSTFGFFFMNTVIWAWVWANFFFMPLMATVGPQQDTPDWLQFPSRQIKNFMAKREAKRAGTKSEETYANSLNK